MQTMEEGLMSRLLVLLSLLLAFAFPSFALADDATPSDAAKAVIEKQLNAFARDDAVEAYSYASPQIQAMFPDPNIFFAMVVTTYPPVYHHSAVAFGPSEEKDGTLGQAVTFTDPNGEVWMALYTLQKQDDGRWTITGCVLSRSTEKAL